MSPCEAARYGLGQRLSFAQFDNSGKRRDSRTCKSSGLPRKLRFRHVIVIIGENRTFDHIFATYLPKQGETVNNLLSEGIVQADGTPGSNFAISHQDSAVNKLADRY